MFNLTSAVFAPKAIFKLRKWHKQIQFSRLQHKTSNSLNAFLPVVDGASMGLGSFDEKFQPNGVLLAAKENTWRNILVFPIQIKSESISFRPLRLQTRPSVWACDPLTQAQLCLLGLGARQVPPWDSQSLFDHFKTVSSHRRGEIHLAVPSDTALPSSRQGWKPPETRCRECSVWSGKWTDN